MWELVTTDPEGVVTERLPVPGGWLYRLRLAEIVSGVVFVPGAITPPPAQ